MQEMISIGKVLNFHGILGEAKVGYSKGKDAQIKALKEVFIKNKKFHITNVRFHKQFAIIKFEEINSINDLLEFKGENICIPKSDVKKSLNTDEYLVEDLIGLVVFDNNDDVIGTVKSVGNNGAGDILCVINEQMKRETLIPFTKELVPVVDVRNKKIVVKVIEGLIEDDI